jgi:protein-L-isoaspartate O-methyltransferase
VLHIGCGTGYFTLLATSSVQSGRVSAVDVIPTCARGGESVAVALGVGGPGDGRSACLVDVVIVHARHACSTSGRMCA